MLLMLRLFFLVLQLVLISPQATTTVTLDTEVSTFAGSVTQAGSANGDLTAARFTSPTSIAFNSDSSLAILSDQTACLIREVHILSGRVTTLGGFPDNCSYTDGTPAESRFSQPRGLAYSPDDAFLLVLDQGGRAVRRYTLADNTWDTVVSEGSGVLSDAYDITIDRYGSFVLITEQQTSVIIQFSLEDWSIYSIICGQNGTSGFADGANSIHLLEAPASVILSRDGSYALFTDNNAVRMVVLASGEVSTLVGTGSSGHADGNSSSGAMFSRPDGLAFMSATRESYVVVSHLHTDSLTHLPTDSLTHSLTD
jgi:DNA-binding beta-propeller fold protein YncE